MINDESMPEVNFLGEEDTPEEDGTEVTFPIASNDTRLFASAMKKVSFGFDVKPTVEGGFDWPEPETVLDKGFYKLYEYRYDSILPSGVFARMGCVLYPVDQSVVEQNLLDKYSKKPWFLTALSAACLLSLVERPYPMAEKNRPYLL